MKFEIINLFGLIGSIGVAFSLFPQTFKVVKTSKIDSLSIYFIFITLISSILQLIYGLNKEIMPIIIANSCVLINSLILFYFYIKTPHSDGQL